MHPAVRKEIFRTPAFPKYSLIISVVIKTTGQRITPAVNVNPKGPSPKIYNSAGAKRKVSSKENNFTPMISANKTFVKKRITKTLVELIHEIKKNRIKNKNYKCEFRKEFDNEYAKEYYIFGKGKNYISNLFKSDFEGEVPGFNT